MKLISKIKRWFRNKFRPNKRHFFEETPENGCNYSPCLPMSSHYGAVYKSKLSRDSEALMGGRLKSGNKKGKKS